MIPRAVGAVRPRIPPAHRSLGQASRRLPVANRGVAVHVDQWNQASIVMGATSTPILRGDRDAASHPAWPAPTTRMGKRVQAAPGRLETGRMDRRLGRADARVGREIVPIALDLLPMRRAREIAAVTSSSDAAADDFAQRARARRLDPAIKS